MRTRTLLLLAVVATGVPVSVVGGVGVAAGGRASPEPSSAAVVSVAAEPAARGLEILHDWDLRRSRAWADGDVTALRGLYVAGSAVGALDSADLARWTRSGLRVVGLRQQVAAYHLAREAAGRLVVVVTDRTVGGVAVGGGVRTPVPASAWTTHRIGLVHSRTGWRVTEVSAQPAR